MRILTTVCRWLSSVFIGFLVSGVAFACISMMYERLDLQKRLGMDDDVCWLALLVGPALIVFIHRAFHRRAWVPVSTLLGGLVLAGFGLFQFLTARAANAHHVPSGPFSGIEHAFGMVVGLFLGVLAALAVSAAVLALAARRIGRSAEPDAGGNAAAPRASAQRSAASPTVKITISYFVLILLLTACGGRDKQLGDAALRERLTGSWNVKVLHPDGSSDTHGTFVVAADDTFRSELVTIVSNEMRSATLQGFVRIQDGFLVETTTNAVPHWLSESKRGMLPPGGANSRTKIVRFDDHELVIENQFGRVLYTKARK